MTDLQAAVETIQTRRGKKCDCHVKGVNVELHARVHLWPNPLADTPEGDHEWMEIMRWAHERYGERFEFLLFRVCLRITNYEESFKAAFILALADALGKGD